MLHVVFVCIVFMYRDLFQKQRDSLWVEKELQKIHREKQRLDRERSKYEEREERLQKMREAMERQPHKEITVKTAKGEEFKFGGISQKFTKKLYEWEEQRGIAPESSTIALLDPNYNVGDSGGKEKPLEQNGIARSRSEGSLPEAVDTPPVGGNSSQSLNGLGEAKGGEAPFAPALIKFGEEVARQRLSRTESVRAHASIQLLNEKISLIGSLKLKEDRCRQLENTLECLDDQMSNIQRSRMELTELRNEEEREENNVTLLGHLDKKLDDLAHEQVGCWTKCTSIRIEFSQR